MMKKERTEVSNTRTVTPVLNSAEYNRLFSAFVQYMPTDSAVRLARRISNENYRHTANSDGTNVGIFKSELS